VRILIFEKPGQSVHDGRVLCRRRPDPAHLAATLGRFFSASRRARGNKRSLGFARAVNADGVRISIKTGGYLEMSAGNWNTEAFLRVYEKLLEHQALAPARLESMLKAGNLFLAEAPHEALSPSELICVQTIRKLERPLREHASLENTFDLAAFERRLLDLVKHEVEARRQHAKAREQAERENATVGPEPLDQLSPQVKTALHLFLDALSEWPTALELEAYAFGTRLHKFGVGDFLSVAVVSPRFEPSGAEWQNKLETLLPPASPFSAEVYTVARFNSLKRGLKRLGADVVPLDLGR
jgi:hypothetical protein